jgi:hypothetical protein
MTSNLLHDEICARITSDAVIAQSLQSVIWFGSVKNRQDVHAKSDCDLQIILDKPHLETILTLNNILADYPDIDLSIMYLQDIFDHNGRVIFHDGTKGLFFIYVLAAGEVVYGRNVYQDIVNQFTLDDLKPSLLATVREYLSRLRVMAIQETNDTLRFKKYSTKLFKDILVYRGEESFVEITKITNSHAVEKIQSIHTFSAQSKVALAEITDYEQLCSPEQMASLLYDYEQLIERMCNE